MKSLLAFLILSGLAGMRETPCAHYYDKDLKKNVYTSVEVEPEFPGGKAACMRFLQKNLRYPQQVDSNRVQSTAFMQFIVDTDGQIKNITINDKDSTSLNRFEREVFKVIRSMPTWTPGKCQDTAVAATFKSPLIVHVKVND